MKTEMNIEIKKTVAKSVISIFAIGAIVTAITNSWNVFIMVAFGLFWSLLWYMAKFGEQATEEEIQANLKKTAWLDEFLFWLMCIIGGLIYAGALAGLVMKILGLI